MINVEQICSLNLGKEIDYGDHKVIVDGWNELIDSDIILIQSPLNVSFFYIAPNYEHYRMQLQLP